MLFYSETPGSMYCIGPTCLEGIQLYMYMYSSSPETITTLLINYVVVQLLGHVWLCDPMDCSAPGFPVLHYLPEFAQTHIHWVSDANSTILSSVAPFSSCPQSLPASGSFPVTWLFTSSGQSIRASQLFNARSIRTHWPTARILSAHAQKSACTFEAGLKQG